MRIFKNTAGVSIALTSKFSSLDMIGKMTGSSLDRLPTPKKEKVIKEVDEENFEIEVKKEMVIRKRSMSMRTKSKIRKKIIFFSRLYKNLNFLTLTFVNKVTDKEGVKILGSFFDNVAKLNKDFQYLWVAEKQTKNKIFNDNIHFHLIINKYLKIKKWWQYWIELQAKNGIVPRDENYKPSSAFDIKNINSNDVKGIINYLTKYVTKNSSEFECQVWNCSEKISRLYTDFYTDDDFMKQFERLEAAGQLGGKIKIYSHDFCNIHVIPLNRITMNFYNRLDEKNKEGWNNSD